MKEFEEIYKKFYEPLYGFMMKLTSGDGYLAEEITQECFYQAFISFHKYKGKSTFFVWLCAIAKNCYYKKLNKQKEVLMDVTILADQLIDENDTPVLYEEKEVSKRLRQAIIELNRQQRDIVIYRIYFEISYSEISKIMKISQESAKVIFHRAKLKLREKLGRYK